MKTKTEKVLLVLKVLAWIAMIGYVVQGAGQTISFGLSLFNPVAAKNIYGTSLYLYDIYLHSLEYFIYIMSLFIVLAAMNGYVWYRIARMLTNFNLKEPFSRGVARTLEEVGIQLLGIWTVSIIAEQSISWISKNSGIHLERFHAVNEYLFIAGIVYIISQVFKRGIEIQEENELTV
ncbi:MAG TPA: DUF2975 domain-containing protein [Chryseolinea sp.]